MWCIPTLDEEFIERMTDLLNLYAEPYHPQLPVVCLDEKCVELHDETRTVRVTRRGKRLRDYEYKRGGTANVFVITEPKGGRHYGRVTKHRTRRDFAYALKFLAARYPEAITIHLVMDNLNTHTERSLIHTFGRHDGRALWARFTPHYTPKHGSWLDQAEIVISVYARCALGNRRIPDIETLRRITTHFFANRRRQRWMIDWRFTAKDAAEWVKTFRTED